MSRVWKLRVYLTDGTQFEETCSLEAYGVARYTVEGKNSDLMRLYPWHKVDLVVWDV